MHVAIAAKSIILSFKYFAKATRPGVVNRAGLSFVRCGTVAVLYGHWEEAS
jgi:hypothetical protein